ncbi:MAG: hypothetical protein NC212_06085 [Staphylococcus sp.]|nr:hypothetical protein [Staphylococcus sp.]
MKIIRSAISLLLLVASAGVVSATSPVEEQHEALVNDHKVVFFGQGSDPAADSIRNLVENFYYDQFRSFQDPQAPYFLFMSRDSQLAMGIGGLVRMRGYYDWGGTTGVAGFSPYFIPTQRDELNRQKLGTTPAGTALFFRVIGRNKRLGHYQLYIEANFNGYQGRDFHLKKAYATLNDWTIGYASSTFGDGAAVPPTIDSNGPTMKMDATNVLVRYMHHFKKTGMYIAASVETPDMTIQADNEQAAARSLFVPNFAAMMQYEWATGQHVRLSGIMRFLPYRDLVTGRNHQPVGWGLQLSTVFRPVEPLTVYGTVNGGRSYSNFGGDFLLGKYDLVQCAKCPGKLCTVPGWGYFVGLQYNFKPQIFMSATFGQGRYLPCCRADGSDYKYGLYSALNFFWDVTPRIRFGGEINVGKRQNFDGTHGWARRLGALAQFSF